MSLDYIKELRLGVDFDSKLQSENDILKHVGGYKTRKRNQSEENLCSGKQKFWEVDFDAAQEKVEDMKNSVS